MALTTLSITFELHWNYQERQIAMSTSIFLYSRAKFMAVNLHNEYAQYKRSLLFQDDFRAGSFLHWYNSEQSTEE